MGAGKGRFADFDRLRRPRFGTSWPILAWLAYSVILGNLYAHIPPNPDQAIFDYIGWICAEGGVPYRDAGDENFPGAILLHTLARLAFGDAPWAYRAFDYIGLIGFCLACRATLIRRGERAVATIFVPLYQAMYVTSGAWFAGQRDIIAGHLALLAGFAYLRRLEGARCGWMVAVGVGIWSAAMIKPTFAACLPALALVDFALRGGLRRGLTLVAFDQAIVLLTLAVLTILLASWASLTGALGAWYEMAILLNVEYYAGRSPGRWFVLLSLVKLVRISWHWYWAASTAGVILWWRSGDRPFLLVTLASLGVAMVSAMVQGKGFDYHFGGILPVMGLLAGAAFARFGAAARDPSRPAWTRLAYAVPLAIASLGLASKLNLGYRRQVEWRIGRIATDDYLADYQLTAPAEIARFIRERSSPEDTVLVYSPSFDMIINLISKRRSPVRFVPSILIDMGAPPFSCAQKWLDEWNGAIKLRPPRFIVMLKAVGETASASTDQAPGERSLDQVIAAGYRSVMSLEAPGGNRYHCFQRIR